MIHPSLQGLMKHYGLREAAGASPQTYALGLKEVWEVPEEQHSPGLVVHTVGWPLDSSTYGGGWIYHMDNRWVAAVHAAEAVRLREQRQQCVLRCMACRQGGM
jgi:flavin-dependent dehydrogenase